MVSHGSALLHIADAGVLQRRASSSVTQEQQLGASQALHRQVAWIAAIAEAMDDADCPPVPSGDVRLDGTRTSIERALGD